MNPRQRSIAIVSAAVLLIASLVVIAAVLRRLRAPPSEPGPLSETDARQLAESANLGLGHLENHDSRESIPIFTEIAEKFPDDPFGPRNLAVARVLALGEEYEQVTPQYIEEANAALALVENTEGQSLEWHWLSARARAAANDFAAAEEHMLQVIAGDQMNASAWYELFLIRQSANGGEKRAEAAAALQQAFDLRPDNLFLLVEYLRLLEQRARVQSIDIDRLPDDQRPAARRRAIAEFGDVASRLRRTRQSLLPFRDRLQAISRVDVVQLVDEALAAANEGDLMQMGDRAGGVARVALGTAAPDRNLVRRHVLEFALFRFRPEFYEQYGLLEAEPAPAIEVSFAAAPSWRLDQQVPGALNNIQAIEVADFDLDGRLDLILLDDAGLHVFARTADNESWRRVALSTTVAGMTGLVVQDFDLDFDETPASNADGSKVQRPRSKVEEKDEGRSIQDEAAAMDDAEIARACPSADVDIVAFGPAGVVVLRNSFSPQRQTRSLEPVERAVATQSDVTAVAAADLDADGDLDLVIAANNGPSLWSNRGNATFNDISTRLSPPPADAKITGLVAVDWDRDVDIDLLVSGEPVGWLENLRHGQMRWHTFDDDFPGLSSVQAFELVDADSNASWDLLAATSDGLRLTRTTTPQPGVVRPLDARALSDRPAQRLRSLDYDNDGLVDLVAWDGSGPTMYRALPGSRYEVVDLLPSAPNAVRDSQVGDLDNDGDLDLVVATGDAVHIFINEGGNKNHWLDVSLKARQIKGSETSASGRVNAHGVGNLLELKAGPRYQPAVVRGQTTHFGLGRYSTADVVRVVWLNGVPQSILQPTANRAVCEQQLLTGSCPYLYTWNGTEFEFVTDLLWAAPLGLQAADGVLLPAREWEYLKIPGEKLAAKDGEYTVQLTEELWEAAYFDEVKLIAVDHPADNDIYSNEKVGPAEIAEFKIHTARDKRRPLAAQNHRGRDLLGELALDDGVYAKPFDNKLRQGLVEDHSIELDLGDFAATARVTLFLTGWIYPSGTSLNVAISQHLDLPQPKPPALHVPAGGGWREALPYMGFPGGKTKTIAVDLAGILLNGDHRVRITTNLELYWDQVFFTVDEPPADVRLTELELQSSNLHYRGFSRVIYDRRYGPERFLYGDVSTAAKWPPMQGRFTRAGDVAELLRTRDDRLVVIGAGDEVTLRFRAPRIKPPAGWKRDFVLYSVGWDKDANLCTVLGQAVEPLPFAAMQNYPPRPDDRPPATAEYQRYLRDYQTRVQDLTFWRAIQQSSGSGTPTTADAAHSTATRP